MQEMHVSEICDKKSCDIINCNLRHPQICRDFRDFKFCKFGEWCYFKHLNTAGDFMKVSEKCEQVEIKVSKLEKLLLDKIKMN